MARQKCSATKANGEPCRSFAVRDGLCQAHNPARSIAHKKASSRGGQNRSAQRRAARAWAMKGEQVRQEDLPAILRACIFEVRIGSLEPSMASAIATLAKTSIELKKNLELEDRMAAVEAAIGAQPANSIRRVK